MYYLANYNEKQKIHRGEQTNAFPSWQLADGLEPGKGYFKRVWEFPWLSPADKSPSCRWIDGVPCWVWSWGWKSPQELGRGVDPSSVSCCNTHLWNPLDSLDPGAPGCCQEGWGGSQSRVCAGSEAGGLCCSPRHPFVPLQSIHPGG